MSSDLARALESWAPAFGLTLTPAWVAGCEKHAALLLKWQQRLSLAGYQTPGEFARWGYLEGLFVASDLSDGTLIDVGAGAGLPGAAIALALPTTPIIWLEPQQKRWAFLKEVRRHLALNHVRVERKRFEEFAAPEDAIYLVRALDRLEERMDELLELARRRRGIAVLAGESLCCRIATAEGFAVSRKAIPTAENRWFVLMTRRG